MPGLCPTRVFAPAQLLASLLHDKPTFQQFRAEMGLVRSKHDGLSVMFGMAESFKVCELKDTEHPAQIAMPKTTTKLPTQVQTEKEPLLNGPEVSLFISCLVMVNQLRGLERAFKGGEFGLNAFLDKSNAVLSQLTETVTATERFDIVLPVMDYGQFSPFFWRWFNWWDDYFKGLTPAQIAQIERLARERARNVSDFRPQDHWLAYRHTPAFTLVPT